MSRLTLEQLPAALKSGLSSVYLVSGDEPLLVAEAADAIRAAARSAGFGERTVFFVDRSFDWEELRTSTQSMSLFAERRIIELRLPTGKPDKGAAQLIALAERPPHGISTSPPIAMRGSISSRHRASVATTLPPSGIHQAISPATAYPSAITKSASTRRRTAST